MRIKKILSQYRRDFKAVYECEHCGYSYEDLGYDDSHFHQHVVPKMGCPKCEKIGGDYPEECEGLDDDAVREEFCATDKYSTTWDHVGDAYEEYEKLADAFLEQEALIKELKAAVADPNVSNELAGIRVRAILDTQKKEGKK